jgi:membrane protease YdiL (CAAX protease family)
MKAGRCFLLTVAILALFTAMRALGLMGPARYVWIPVSLLTAALILIAWTAGATRADLGLAPADMRAGVRYGACASGLVLLVLVVAAVIPSTNGFLHDSRAQIGGGRLLYELGVSIVLLTAIPEELAFRGVLLGSALRLWGPLRASLITSALFGLWHVVPTLHTMSDNRAVAGASASAGGQVLVVMGAVAVTFVAGLALCWLRLRSRSLIAPVMAHAATNGLALTVAWFTVHWGRLG